MPDSFFLLPAYAEAGAGMVSGIGGDVSPSLCSPDCLVEPVVRPPEPRIEPRLLHGVARHDLALHRLRTDPVRRADGHAVSAVPRLWLVWRRGGHRDCPLCGDGRFSVGQAIAAQQHGSLRPGTELLLARSICGVVQSGPGSPGHGRLPRRAAPGPGPCLAGDLRLHAREIDPVALGEQRAAGASVWILVRT